jgi:primosomal protein N' (replication factor Y)
MYITKVCPLKRVPRQKVQLFSYFSSKKILPGSLVQVLFGKKEEKAIVFSQKNAQLDKLQIKNADFELKPILKILDQKLLNKYQLELAQWISSFFWTPLGKVLSSLVIGTKKYKNRDPLITKKNNIFSKKLIIAPLDYSPDKQIKEALMAGKQVLILVPEKEKMSFWKDKLPKNKNLIIGTRSKLFIPFVNLGLIVMTEEGNKNYKSQNEPRYDTKNVAQKLAEILGSEIIFLSQFPSVETYYENTDSKIFLEDEHPKKCHIIDMNKIKPWKPLSPDLVSQIKKTLNNNGHILLFINRKGAATTLICNDCGWIHKCENCDAPLVYHLGNKINNNPKMICHHCGYENFVPNLCKNCKSWNLTTLGVGIERVEKDIKNIFPNENILSLDGQTQKIIQEQKKILANFLQKGNILVTTSLIFKYLPIKKIPLTAIISLDSLLLMPDAKIEEECARTVQELCSVTSRKLIIQTMVPQSRAIKWVNKTKQYFYEKNLNDRKKMDYPPFSQLIELSISEKIRNKAVEQAHGLKNLLRKNISSKFIEVIGPLPSYIEKTKGKYEWKIIIKIKKEREELKDDIFKNVPLNWKVEVNPLKIL